MTSVKYAPLCRFFDFADEKFGDHSILMLGIRHKCKLTSKELAAFLEIPNKQLSKIEQGFAGIDNITALRIEKIFKIPYSYVMGDQVKFYIGLPNSP